MCLEQNEPGGQREEVKQRRDGGKSRQSRASPCYGCHNRNRCSLLLLNPFGHGLVPTFHALLSPLEIEPTQV